MSKKQVIAGNWKMNGTITGAEHYLDSLLSQTLNNNSEVVICPPFTLLHLFRQKLQDSTFVLGGQDCHFESEGSFTGDISPNMLMDMSCRYVILGHSERRTKHYETNYLVSKKASAAHRAGLATIICVGENKLDKDNNQTADVVSRQVKFSLPNNFTADNLIIAYEPIWAIGTDTIPSHSEIQDAINNIRNTLVNLSSTEVANNIRILYGGSVNASNASEILALEGVDGVLVGGKSLNADDFVSIINSSK